MLHSKWCNFGTQPKMTLIIKILLILCIEYGQIEVSKLVRILQEKYNKSYSHSCKSCVKLLSKLRFNLSERRAKKACNVSDDTFFKLLIKACIDANY